MIDLRYVSLLDRLINLRVVLKKYSTCCQIGIHKFCNSTIKLSLSIAKNFYSKS